ncbi:signal peptidase [Chryseobacterium sp. SL1]|uniref:signal peptidase n=1 Tax=Chryseobacterium sp. SL1 TaxID=2995159 RepID=UPI0022748223|nr:signal peptidase [Chryseobacterium sp. SL1]MCY1660101.1 signal peptidase [Chryseobacterium sp. SL1]
MSAQAPPNPGDGGTGGSGSGGTVVSSPIDMYVYALGIIAVLFIAFFTKKYTAKKA